MLLRKTVRFILGDQLSRSVSSLRDARPEKDVILMAEVMDEVASVKHHKQKVVLVLSAMRHFARSLQAEGFDLDYVTLDEPDNTHSFSGELQRAVARHGADQVVVTQASEWRVNEMMASWGEGLAAPVEIRPDDRLLCSREDFSAWAGGRRNLRMEFFYRHMRQKTGFLMNGNEPVGGQWNFDSDNRKALGKDVALPPRLRFEPDVITRAVMDMVARRCGDHYGTLGSFGWAVTRDEALQALDHFVRYSLPSFGTYQDTMKDGADYLYHSVLSPYINIGLLLPREVCEAAEEAHVHGRAPLNAVEGFIRQVIGWREFVSGVYWSQMPGYQESNFLGGKRPLPGFFWWGEAPLRCLAEALRNTRENAYAHHIQRLMVIGNFAILADIAPKAIEEWFLVVYADAFEWVELPNVHGMVMHADGGHLASKPYVASGAYINRMSDHCAKCQFDPAVKTGPKACPYNYLYWNFLAEHEGKLAGNPRMAMPYRNLKRMAPAQLSEIRAEARQFLDGLD